MKNALLFFPVWTGYLATSSSLTRHTFSTALLNLQTTVTSSLNRLFPSQRSPRQLSCFSDELSLHSFDYFEPFLVLLHFCSGMDQNFMLHSDPSAHQFTQCKTVFCLILYLLLSHSQHLSDLLLSNELMFP